MGRTFLTATVLVATLAVAGCSSTASPAHHGASPTDQGTSAAPPACTNWRNPTKQSQLQAAIKAAAQRTVIDSHLAPSTTISVGCLDHQAVSLGLGGTTPANAVRPDATQYDLASVSKTITAIGVLMLAQEGRLRLDDSVSKVLPSFKSGQRAQVTYRLLLQHRSGLPEAPYDQVLAKATTPQQVLGHALWYPLARTPGTGFTYSNIDYAILWEAAQRAAGQPFDQYLAAKLFRPLGLQHTGYLPKSHCAPTSPDADQTKVLVCTAQDRLSHALGGVTGNAGLFATANDLGRIAAMLANGGAIDGHRYLSAASLRLMSTPQSDSAYAYGAWTNIHHAYGKRMSAAAFGHYGWTGTAMFIDPQTHAWVVILTNATYRRPVNDTLAHQAVQAVNDTAAELAR